MQARFIGKYKGKRMYRVPVHVRLNNSRDLSYTDLRVEVIAQSAAAAANLVRDEWATRPETEVSAFGPKGGEVSRFVGWDSGIYASLMERARAPHQLTLEV